MYNHLLYLTYWGANVLVLYFLGRAFPDNVTLGVNKFVPIEAAVYSGFWMTFIVWTFWDFIIAQGAKFGSSWGAYAYFFGANAVAAGIVSMFSGITGTQIDTLSWVIVVGGVANACQNLAKEKLLAPAKG